MWLMFLVKTRRENVCPPILYKVMTPTPAPNNLLRKASNG